AHSALRRTLGSLRVLRPLTVPKELSVACGASGVPSDIVHSIHGLPTPAFTAGWFRPRIYVAASVVTSLSQAELGAVIAHEAAHVSRRDPLRSSLLRFLADILFYIPALRRL